MSNDPYLEIATLQGENLALKQKYKELLEEAEEVSRLNMQISQLNDELLKGMTKMTELAKIIHEEKKMLVNAIDQALVMGVEPPTQAEILRSALIMVKKEGKERLHGWENESRAKRTH